jgi:hypothetical protein
VAGTHNVPHSFAFIDHWTLYIVSIVNFTTAHYAYLRVSIASLDCDALAFRNSSLLCRSRRQQVVSVYPFTY